MKWRVAGPGKDTWFTLRGEPLPNRASALSADAGAWLLSGLDGGAPADVLQEIFSALYGRMAPSAEALGEGLTQALSDGRLVAFHAPEQLSGAPLPKPPEPKTDPPPANKTWIKIKILDDETSSPLLNVVLDVTLPDGSVSQRTTNKDGVVEIQNLDPGTCDVTSPYKSGQVGNTMNALTSGPDVRFAGPASSDKLYVAEIDSHKVKTGETLDKLATDAGITWQELAVFNWGVSSPGAVNERLEDEVGCTKRTADKANMVFDDSDDPGIVNIPKKWDKKGLATGKEHTFRVKTPTLILMHMYVDADRDGAVDWSRRGLDKWEWGKAKKGAIILCNNDDDDTSLDPGFGVEDNQDAIVNKGNDDSEIAPLTLRRFGPTPPPAGSSATLKVSDKDKIRIFDGRSAGANEIIGPTKGDTFTFSNLSPTSFEFGMEATRYAGADFESGEITLTLKVTTPRGSYEEKAVVRVAPWIMPNHLDAAEKVFVVDAGAHNLRFRNELDVMVKGAGCSLVQHASNDVWMQDCMELGFSNLPKKGIRAVTKAARPRPLESFPKTLLTADLGFNDPVVSAPERSTFDSTGNLECTPPAKSKAGKDYPFGRIYFGGVGRGVAPLVKQFNADVALFLKKQVVQEPIVVDTSWLAVGHVDEFISFVPGGPKGFTMLLADADLGLSIVDGAKNMTDTYTVVSGDWLDKIAKRYGMTAMELWKYEGDTGLPNSKRLKSGNPNLIYAGEVIVVPARMLIGRDFDGKKAEVTITEFVTKGITAMGLDIAALRTFNTAVQGHIKTTQVQFETEIGLDPATDLIRVPAIFFPNERSPAFADALTAGMVNMLVINKNCVIPKPFGPVASGKDLFEEDLKGKLTALGLGVNFLDDWYEYHVALGEVHCGTNTLRAPTQVPWWELTP